MIDFHSAREIISACFYLASGTALLFIFEIAFGENVRDFLRGLRKQDDTEVGHK